MKKIKRSQFLLIFVLGIALSCGHLLAEEEYHHERHAATHGGLFGDAGDIYHYELIMGKDGLLKLYLYDEEVLPMRVTGIPARWAICPQDANPFKGNFSESENGDYYWVKFPQTTSEIVHVLVEVDKNGEWIPMEFPIPLEKK